MYSSARSVCVLLLICGYTSASTSSNKTVADDLTTTASIFRGSRITERLAAKIRDFPFQATLFQNNSFLCDASIITSRFAITSGSCLSRNWKPEWIHVRVGIDKRNGLGFVHRAKDFFVHPRYHSLSPIRQYNLALVEVWNRFRWLPSVAPTKLPSPGFVVPNGAIATVSGFGFTESAELMYARLPVLGLEECLKMYSSETRRGICANTNNTINGGYVGNFGAPLVLNGVQVGVFDWRSTSTSVARFTNLADEVIHAWIMSHI